MLTFLLLLIIIYFAVGKFYLKGHDLRKYDRPVGKFFGPYTEDQPYIDTFKKFFRSAFKSAYAKNGSKAKLNATRDVANRFSEGLVFNGNYIPIATEDFAGEWVIAPGVDTSRRVLFMHGGGFFVGSAKGHRRMSAHLSKSANAAVFSLNYRLLPENSIKDAHKDSRNAYRWLLNNGPEGESAAAKIFISGDSAGGNLALSLSAWLTDEPLLSPSAVVAICPSTDSTLSGPSHFYNYGKDIMLGYPIGKLTRHVPNLLLNWLVLLFFRVKPSNPAYSPIHGELRNLPPTLIHASDTEILFSDSLRYANKAREAGSDVSLEIWRNQPHDWHLVVEESRSGKEAWESITNFLNRS